MRIECSSTRRSGRDLLSSSLEFRWKGAVQHDSRPAKGSATTVEEFWVRSGNATIQLHGDDLLTYKEERWDLASIGAELSPLPEIVDGNRSGGASTSQTIAVQDLQLLLDRLGTKATASDYERAVIEDNVLGKRTSESRRRTLRYIRELYILRPDSVLFRALGDLWNDDRAGQPLLAGLCALARDPVFRASAHAIFECEPGDRVTSSDLAEAVAKDFPMSYSDSTLAKTGRNTFASWEQTGHLKALGRSMKVRQRAACTPSAIAFALLLGHLSGLSGLALFETLWTRALDRPRTQLLEMASVASQRSLIDFRYSGGVLEVGFSHLLRAGEMRQS